MKIRSKTINFGLFVIIVIVFPSPAQYLNFGWKVSSEENLGLEAREGNDGLYLEAVYAQPSDPGVIPHA